MVTLIDDDDVKLPPELRLKRIVNLRQAGQLSNLSVNSLKRNHRDKIVTLSPRRLGMRLGDALMLRKSA